MFNYILNRYIIPIGITFGIPLGVVAVVVFTWKFYKKKKSEKMYLENSQIETLEELNILIKNLNKLIETKHGDV